MLPSELDISFLRLYFDDTYGQKLSPGVVNLPSKCHQNPTVNESGIDVLVRQFHGKRDLHYLFFLSLIQDSLSLSVSSSTTIHDK
jgi:hypothetical protein